MKLRLALLTILMTGTVANAAEPVGANHFNTDPGFDIEALSTDNFYSVVEEQAKTEGQLVFFDFTNSFGPLFQEYLLPSFEGEYGIEVQYIRGNGDIAAQQLVAAVNAGTAAPADAYFVSSGGTLTSILGKDVIANIPLQDVLPNAATFDHELAVNVAGNDHGGIYMPFHRNQTTMVYNSAMVSGGDLPTTLDALLAWAKANPGKLAVTNPGRGGSGDGFLQSVAIGLVTGDDCRAAFTEFAITEEEAKAYAAGDCAKPVWDYYHDLIPVSEITNGNSDTLNLLANGVVAIGTAWEDMAFDFMGRGLLPQTTRQMILETGQVGGGDGMFLPVHGEHPAAALLFLNYMASKEAQLTKLGFNGSRSARTDIDPGKEFTEEQANRLAPADQYPSRAKAQLPQMLKQAMIDYFKANILRS